ncbi:MAG: hypothetical protein ACTSRI_03140 [Promethearchaeota archaeon]
MKLELSDLNNGNVFIGDKLKVQVKYIFDEKESIFWSGIRLITKPPCSKELQIIKEEIFSKGIFEAGKYIREKALLLKNNIIPTIKKRNLEYDIELLLRKENPINPDVDLVLKKAQKINIKLKESILQSQKTNPISFSISGLSINLSKDIFKPGEAIKINYSSQHLKEIEIRLLQKANLICSCEMFGKKCKQIEELPPAIAADVKTSNTKEGFVLLKVPEIAEPSHNYLWEPIDKEYWGTKYGDYCEWFLLLIGKKKPEFGRDQIKFQVPVTISSRPIIEKKINVDLFSGASSGAPSLFNEISSKFQKRFQMISIDSDFKKDSASRVYKIKLRNISKKDLQGVTVKLSGLQQGLFETPPNLIGFNSWEKDEEKEINYVAEKQNISAIISIIEDNSQNSVRIQTPISF